MPSGASSVRETESNRRLFILLYSSVSVVTGILSFTRSGSDVKSWIDCIDKVHEDVTAVNMIYQLVQVSLTTNSLHITKGTTELLLMSFKYLRESIKSADINVGSRLQNFSFKQKLLSSF